ncbi:SRPBCC family protein [Sinosporangium siamense]|uniref:Polyketide cyclase n=1 Tax=Sinosporangium siamense TaxID=1367973 RepID=A0A919V8F9_9ACTN|nr:SRPBCC family protein [Sinosporangium siamense]GII94413.1 polyketide cyclase [Sinosporangium siamense]
MTIAIAVSAALVVVLVTIGTLLGRRLPVGHRTTTRVRLRRKPAAVWKVLANMEAYPAWRPELSQVEKLPDENGKPRWRQHEGGDKTTYELVEAASPHRLVFRVTGGRRSYGGSQAYEITRSPTGCTVTLTEHGEVYNPVLRLLYRHLVGHGTTARRTLKALAARFGEEAAIEDVTPGDAQPG